MASPSWEVPIPEALGDPCHGHACLRGSGIHCGHGTAESRQRRQVMEPNAWLDLGGQHLQGVSSQAVRRQESQVPMVFTEVGSQGSAKLCWYCSPRTE